MLIIPPCSVRDELLQEAHVPMYSGHGGRHKTYNQLQLSGVVWPGMYKDVVDMVSRKKLDAVQFAEIFVNSIVLRYGLPKVIISDRDPRFARKVYNMASTCLIRLLAVMSGLTSATVVVGR